MKYNYSKKSKVTNTYVHGVYVNRSIKQGMEILFLKHSRLDCGTPDRL
jgi:hypothetical protein